jgi:hypothetical protein
MLACQSTLLPECKLMLLKHALWTLGVCKELLVRAVLQFCILLSLCAPPAFVSVGHCRRPISIPPVILNHCGFTVHHYDHPDVRKTGRGISISAKGSVSSILGNLQLPLRVAAAHINFSTMAFALYGPWISRRCRKFKKNVQVKFLPACEISVL